MFSSSLRRGRAALLTVAATATVGHLALAPAAAAAPSAPAPATQAQPLDPGTRFTTPVPDPGAVRQTIDLARADRFADAELIAREAATPQAIWFTDGTPMQVRHEVRKASALARATGSVPTFVVYNVPGRDCSQYSAGGAADDAAYRAWVDGFAAGLMRNQQVVVVIEPDGLALMPGDCPPGTYPAGTAPTDAGRLADIRYAGEAIERANPDALVYLDAGHTGWHNVGSIADRLQDAGVAEFQGLALNTSNYQYTPNLAQYGTWISECLAVLPATYVHGIDADPCPNQYWNGGPANGFVGGALDPFQQWSDTATDPAANTLGINQRYDALLGDLEPTAHVVIDTSRNGQGPWAPAEGTYPDPQTWCNPPGRGLGPRPQAAPDPAFPLVDAYLWVKTPGQSDGSCNRGITGSTTDPEWGGITDPAAGAWFPEQALQLAQLAVPALR
ncbi:hypothetical protein IN07_08585 [Modestobacter caceresii]|jgi:endoglucanase|uniref:Glucanase n=1 Tax=Modestobacter caceresii TaxID=1522368 RepID=A0A098Y9M9_9ACTN|nr:glycoside hydrolase family 6 protein [Modestobacter caceresii]KGH47125.1 hypothetical protein IN07_08585 [Modestobacter caceresii]